MDLPTTRELELEILLREREEQVTELGDEVTRLRQFLASQPGPSTADPVTLPPPLVSLLLPHLNDSGRASTVSNSTSTALTQRVRLLQEENDELYNILKQGETGRLKEEVQGLRRIVSKLEGALRESHQVISSLSAELDKSYEAFTMTASTRQNSSVKSYPRSPRNSYHGQGNNTGNGSTSSRLPPTGPRAHKKPRLSESQTSPSLRSNVSLPPSHSNSHRSRSNSSRNNDRSPRASPEVRGGKPNNVKMEVDEDARTRPRSPEEPRRGRDRGGRESERDRDRGRGRERERDHDGNRSRRNGNANYPRTSSGRAGGGGGGRASSRRPNDTNAPPLTENLHSGGNAGGERTLVERMGLGQ